MFSFLICRVVSVCETLFFRIRRYRVISAYLIVNKLLLNYVLSVVYSTCTSGYIAPMVDERMRI
jgi:hypothetical protein